MASASYAVTSFLGGEISDFAQGRFDKPDYRISLNVCLNWMPAEIGPLVRRPGSAFAGATRGGNPGRVISWAFEQASPYSIEFTDGFLRFRLGTQWATNNATQTITGLSTANPAVVTIAVAPSSGATGTFGNLGTSCPLLQNRQFTVTNIDSTHFSITDALTGANIDGSTLGAFATGATFSVIQEVAAPYVGGAWSSVRMVQAETTGILLTSNFAPQALTINNLPSTSSSAQFVLAPATFNDGPYLDPFTNGVQATPNKKTGIVQLTLSFPAWDPTISYGKGDFVTAGSINYESLIDQNIGNPLAVSFSSSSASCSATNTFAVNNQVIFFVSGGALPVALTAGVVYHVIASGLSGSAFEVSATQGGSAITMAAAGTGTMTVALAPGSSPAAWATANASTAINPPATQPKGAGQGFLPTDIGRLVRLFSEPPLWTAGGVYAEGAVVAYNPTNQPGAATYWQGIANPPAVGAIPGSDLTNWELVAPGAALPTLPDGTQSVGAQAGPAQWTCGKIVSLLNFIAGNVSGVAQVGNMTASGGLSSAFNGNTSQIALASAGLVGGFTNVVGNPPSVLSGYVGQNYSGTSAAEYAVQSVSVWPTSDQGFAVVKNLNGNPIFSITITAKLYSSNSPPSSSENGILQGTTVAVANGVQTVGSGIWGTSPVTIVSADQSTQYAYWWVELAVSVAVTFNASNFSITSGIAQVEFVQGAGSGAAANGVNVELIGPPLLYTTAIRTWRLGAYSGTTGWPTTGTYAGGRLWLGGAINNRFDACVSNGIVGGDVNFAPTDQYGTVSDSSAISYTFNSEGVNPILWMTPVIQNTVLRGIIMGSQPREWFVFPPGNGPLTPTNIDAVPATKIGCANVLPVQTEHTLLFVQRYLLKLIEYFSDVFSGKYTGPNLADKAQHIVRAGIAELAYTHAATPIVWGRCGDGSFFGMTYKRDTLMTAQGPTFYGWHRQALGSGRDVESLTSCASVGGDLDALTMVTNATGVTDPQANIRHVEILTDITDEQTPIADCWFLDDAVVPSSTVSTNTGGTGQGGITLNGLWHLNGEKATVFCGGLDCGDYTVTNGSVFVPYGDGISAGTGGGLFTQQVAAANQIVVGFTYNSDGQLVRPQAPQDVGTRNGPALGKRRRFHKVAALFSNLGMGNVRNQSALQIGRDFNHLTPVILSPQTVPDLLQLAPGQTFSGIWKDTVQSDSNYDGMVAWRISRPLPGNIVALEPLLQGEDE